MSERRRWLRRHADRRHHVDVRYALMMLVALIASYGAWSAYTAGQDLATNVRDQASNRTQNVVIWCRAINQGRDYDRALVRRFHVTYRLRDLDCRAIERQTLASTKAR